MTKKIALVLCLVVLVGVFAIRGTMSYLEAEDSVTNVFTMGDINVELTEPGWDPDDGKEIYPGDSFSKDPTITATRGDIYFRVKVELTFEAGTVVADASALVWQTICYGGNPGFNLGAFTLTPASAEANIRYYTYTGGTVLPAVLTEGGSVVLFENITIPTSWGNDEFDTIGDYDIVISVEAIQAANIEPEDAAGALSLAFGD